MPVVARLSMTPVKSTRVHEVGRIDLRAEGAVGDRRFLFARLDGTRPSGISKAPLIGMRAEWDRDAERLSFTTTNGEVIEGDARPRGDAVEVALFDRMVLARRVDPVFDELTSGFDETLVVMRVDEPEYAGGVHRVSIMSSASVADVGARGGNEDLDPRRFRMLIELEGLEPYEEDSWRGREVRIGEAVVELGERMPRCVMTTLDPDTGAKDFDTLGVLATHRMVGNDLLLGLYGDVVHPGVIERGAEAELGATR